MKIAVLGTLSIHLVAEVDRLPRPGETVPSRGVGREPGGTGTLQAIAAARLGAAVTLYGRVGADPFGDEILSSLRGAEVEIAAVERSVRDPTGASLLLIEPTRQFLAAQAGGANGGVDEAYIARFLPPIREADAVLLDLAIPAPALASLLAGLPPARPIVVLHPIPPRDLPLPWERVDFLVGSREALASPTAGSSPEEAARAGQALLARGVRSVVITSGPDGAYLIEGAGATRFPGHSLPVVDPTGAADAFRAALAVKLAGGRGPYEAVGFATAAAALAAARQGGPLSFPTAAEVQELLARPALP
ncbi:MAG: PfkB family carbohydrate kinase [Candidatus Bipolaricaulis sp.]